MADGYASRFDQVNYTALQERLLDAVLAAPGSGNLAKPGIRPGGLGVSVGGTPESVTVAPGLGIITDSGAGGSYRFAIPAAVTRTLATRPASGTSRIDVVYAAIRNVDHRPADGVKDVSIGVAVGNAAASPLAPTIPAGALKGPQLLVPATGAVSVSGAWPRTASLGGAIPVADQNERDALNPTAYNGLMVYREDLSILEVFALQGWRPVPPTYSYQDGSTFTAAAGFTRVFARLLHRPGDTVTAHLRLTRTGTDIPAGLNALMLGTFASQFWPLSQPGIMVGYPGGLTASIAPSDGVLTLRSAVHTVASGLDIILTGTWPAKSFA